MPKIRCRELGGDCDYVAEAETRAQLRLELIEHVNNAHRDRVSRMTEDERDALNVRIDQVVRRR